ncbi:hypothetical protein FM131_01705 [Weissella confusa]|uniref:hypothetical protein n=1 Tax=Weissella confusa TaxID=1583 RepID=UPI000989A1B1|nr:hypothetical protein [Weissella confusa]SJX67644.1 hypothetical protein FM131_01705 [Weissella confusa]
MTDRTREFTTNIVDQGVASYVDYLEHLRIDDLLKNLSSIMSSETQKLEPIFVNQAKALASLDVAKANIKNVIDTQRGGVRGMHGFIAESAEVGISNAKRILQGKPGAEKWINNNGPADLLVNNKPVQMKFYKDILGGLKQARNYPDMQMMFPKDQMDVVRQVMSGKTNVSFNGNKLSSRQIQAIYNRVMEESKLRGESFEKWLLSSKLTSQQVQANTVNQTIADETNRVNQEANAQQQNVKDEANKQRLEAQQQAQPSFGEATKVAGIGAAVQGGMNFAIYVYQQHKSGKEVWEFDLDDWQHAGLTTAKGAIKGGVSGYAIYGLTEVAHLSAPSAGAVVSGTFGLANAILKYRAGEVDEDEFTSLVTLNAIDATGAAAGAAIGQVLIPVPVLGAVIGSLVTTTALSLGEGMLNKHEIEIINQYKAKMDAYTSKLDDQLREELLVLLDKVKRIGELQQYAFDLSVNVSLRLEASVELAREVGVPEEKILHNTSEIDDFFLS